MKKLISMRTLCAAAVAAIATSNIFLASCNGEDDYELNGEYTLAEGRMTRSDDAGAGAEVPGFAEKTITGKYTFYHTEDDSTQNDSVISEVTLNITFYYNGCSGNNISIVQYDVFSSMSVKRHSVFQDKPLHIYAILAGFKNDKEYRAEVNGHL